MIIIPILFFFSEQTTAGIASSHYNIIFSTYLVADRELSNSIALIKEGGTPTNLGYIMSLLGIIKFEKGEFIIWWRSLWIVSTGFVAIEMAVFLIGAKVYFSSLNESIKVSSLSSFPISSLRSLLVRSLMVICTETASSTLDCTFLDSTTLFDEK